VNSIAISLAIIPLTALSIALSAIVSEWSGGVVDLGLCRVHPLTLMVVIGIGLQGLAECFLSPKWLEFASKQAPPGEVGLYMGYAHLTSVFAYLFGFILAGLMLDRYCPDPTTLEEAVRAEYDAALATGGTLPAVYAHAHYIWYFFTGLGVAAFAALLVFKFVTERLDRRRAHQGAAAIP
jgi:MFS family permease